MHEMMASYLKCRQPDQPDKGRLVLIEQVLHCPAIQVCHPVLQQRAKNHDYLFRSTIYAMDVVLLIHPRVQLVYSSERD